MPMVLQPMWERRPAQMLRSEARSEVTAILESGEKMCGERMKFTSSFMAASWVC